jgi:hypothetical protein
MGSWGQHGDWKSWGAQKRYMKTDTPRLLPLLRDAMGPPKTPAPDVRIECESGDGGGRAAPRRGRCTDGSVCLFVERREEKSSISSGWLHGGLWISHAAESC